MKFRIIYVTALLISSIVVFSSIYDAIITFGAEYSLSLDKYIVEAALYFIFIVTIFLRSSIKYYFTALISLLILLKIVKEAFDIWEFSNTDKGIIEYYTHNSSIFILVLGVSFFIFFACMFLSIQKIISFKKNGMHSNEEKQP